MREFDHSEQVILMKLISVYEKRQAKLSEVRLIAASSTSATLKNFMGLG